MLKKGFDILFLISGFVCISFSVSMFFILKLFSSVYPVSTLGTGGEANLNYFAFEFITFPVILLIIGVLLVFTQLFLNIKEKKTRNF